MMNDSELPQVRTGKRPNEAMNVRYILPLPAETPFGNLALKYTLILERLDHINYLVGQVYATYHVGKADLGPGMSVLQHHSAAVAEVP